MSEQNQIEQGFWQQHDRFLKSVLLTEQPHPDTSKLSDLAEQDVTAAIAILKAIDMDLLNTLLRFENDFNALQTAMQNTLQGGGKIFICGCGATGRLAVSLEVCWRAQSENDAVQAIIAGGDTALIHSIEKFEDQGEYGVKQLVAAGFANKDLLIAASAGGESPFVLAAAEHAAKIAIEKPWLIYCNADAALLERNPSHPLNNPKIRSWSLQIGAMALTGSTRMQATTALMIAIGLPLLVHPLRLATELQNFTSVLTRCDFSKLAPFIIKEAALYGSGHALHYVTDPKYGLTVLTDTTERAPTFNLRPFENRFDESRMPSWCYLKLRNQTNAKQAWQAILGRSPKALDWPEFPITDTERLYGFDFSENVSQWRKVKAIELVIHEQDAEFVWHLESLQANFNCIGLSYFWRQILLKLLLNIHSTLVMGRLKKYEGNLMTSVNPSNYKLIDRAIRYTAARYKQISGKDLAYKQVASAVFAEFKSLKPGESIVHNALYRLML